MLSFFPVGKWRQRLRWALWVAFGLVILIAIGAGLVWYSLERAAAEGKKELAAVIAETDVLDPRWRWEQIEEDQPAIPDAENSMRVISQVADSLQGWDPSTVTTPAGEYQEYVLDEYPANHVLDEQRFAMIRKSLEKRHTSLALAVTLKDFPQGRATIQLAPDFVSTQLRHPLDCRAAIRLLELAIEEILDQDHAEQAVDCIRAILHAGEGLRHDPSLISQLSRMMGRTVAIQRIERLLGMSKVGDDDLSQLTADFMADRDERPLLAGIRGERASLNVLFENLESDRVSLADLISSWGYARDYKPEFSHHFAAFRYHPLLYDDHAFMLVTMNDAFKIAELPLGQQARAWKDWDHRIRTAKAEAAVEEKRKLVTALLLPSLTQVAVTALRDHARLSCVLSALAAERFRLAQQRWPKDLKELVPAYLPEVPIDPFDGQPLKFAQREDGIIIYSVDKDGKDDGGHIHKQSPDDDDPKDLGVRLWNPDYRRLPPEPRKKEQPKDDDEGS